jgi:carboxymethylenebutenolidase
MIRLHALRKFLRRLCWCVLLGASAGQAQAAPQTVYFPSADGKTELVGYLFAPVAAQGTAQEPHPAIVLLHGRGGPYSSNVNAQCARVTRDDPSPCSSATLSRRHQMWAEYWAGHGYVALVVDSFGPRGRAHGYGRHSHDDPDRDEVNERSVRPLDAEGALAWLALQPGVRPERVMLQGWSNGGSTALNVMARQASRGTQPGSTRFRAALVFYPGCGPKALISQRFVADAPLWVLLGSEDEEVSPSVCSNVLGAARGGPVRVIVYDGATHDFDDPGKQRQSIAANRQAKEDAIGRAATLLDGVP